MKRFTDREEPRKIFRDALEEAIRDDSGKVSVLDFYGIGGIGKTALLMELKKILASDKSPVKARLETEAIKRQKARTKKRRFKLFGRKWLFDCFGVFFDNFF